MNFTTERYYWLAINASRATRGFMVRNRIAIWWA